MRAHQVYRVDTRDALSGGLHWLGLFVAPAPGYQLDDDLRQKIVTTLRSLELNATSPLRKSGSPPPALSRSSGGALRLRRALSEARRPDDRPPSW